MFSLVRRIAALNLPVTSQRRSRTSRSWIIFPYVATTSLAVLSTTVACEEKESDLNDHQPAEEDDETNCFLCKTHRQGPCGSFWRPFERCVKDNDEGSTLCDVFIKPFEECWSNHVGVYLLIALAVNQETVVDQIELQYKKKKKKQWNPKVDWAAWKDLVRQKAGFGHVCRLVEGWEQLENAKDLVLWKRFQMLEKDPIVISVSASIPKVKDGKRLCVVYALDQDGQVVGMSEYDQGYEKDKALRENKPIPKQHNLVISLIPGMTRSVQIKALFREPDSDSTGKLNGVLYEGPQITLPSETAL
jgi:hypothetical protein